MFRRIVIIAISMNLTSALFALGSGAFSNQSGASAKVNAHGYSFAGVADDPSAAFFNPAGLTQSNGIGLQIGSSFVDFSAEHTSRTGSNDEMDNDLEAVPYLYLSLGRDESPWAFGLSLNSPFGLATNWKENSFSRYFATESRISMYNINPSVAYRVNEKFSVAGGLNFFNVFDVTLKSKVPNQDSPFIPGTPTGDADAEVSGDGTGYGYNLGLLYKASDKHSFGLTYRSQVNVIIEGETKLSNLQDATAFAFDPLTLSSEFKTDTESELKFPQSVTLGYGFRPTEKLTVFADYEWVDWHSFKETKFNYSNNNPFLTQAIDRDWRDTSNLGLGVEWWATPAVALRGGALFYEAVIPSSRLESSLPDTGRWALTVGPGFRFGDFTLDLNYQAVFLDSQSVDTNQSTLAADLDGKYEGYISVFSAGVGYRWGAKS